VIALENSPQGLAVAQGVYNLLFLNSGVTEPKSTNF